MVIIVHGRRRLINFGKLLDISSVDLRNSLWADLFVHLQASESARESTRSILLL